MLYQQPQVPERMCTGKLLGIWAVYAAGMSWLWHALSANGFSAATIWAVAGVAGAAVLLATREI